MEHYLLVTKTDSSFTINVFQALLSITVLLLSIVVSVASSLVTFTWKAAEFKASLETKELILKNRVTELEKDSAILDKKLDEQIRRLLRKYGNLDARSMAIELFMAKQFSFVPKETRRDD